MNLMETQVAAVALIKVINCNATLIVSHLQIIQSRLTLFGVKI